MWHVHVRLRNKDIRHAETNESNFSTPTPEQDPSFTGNGVTSITWNLLLRLQVVHLSMSIFGTITVTFHEPSCRLKAPATRQFIQQMIQTNKQEKCKAPHSWPLWGESTGDREIPLVKQQYCRTDSPRKASVMPKALPFHEVVIKCSDKYSI